MHGRAPTTQQQRARFRDTLGRLHRRFNALQRGERRCLGLTMSQCLTLELLSREGPKTVRELAVGLGLDTSTVTRIVDVLVRDRLLSRARDEAGDRRRVYVSLGRRGRGVAGQLEECTDGYTGGILRRIPADRREDVLRALDIVVEALDECCRCGEAEE